MAFLAKIKKLILVILVPVVFLGGTSLLFLYISAYNFHTTIKTVIFMK